MYLPPDFGAELDARTSDGGIRNELQVDFAADGRRQRTRTIRRQQPRRRGGGKLLKSGPATARSAYASATLDHARFSPPLGLTAYVGRILAARLCERVAPLAAFAASSAMQARRRLHARQRQLQRDAQRPTRAGSRPPCAVRKAAPRSAIGVREPDRQRLRNASKNAGRGVGERIAGERADQTRAIFRARHEDRRLGQQHDVAAFEVDVLVRCVERRAPRRGWPNGSADRRRACRSAATPAAERRRRGGVVQAAARATARSSASHARPTLT